MKGYFDPRWVLYIDRIWISFGWYAAEPFKLFSILVLELWEGIEQEIDTVTILDIQFLKLAFSVGFYTDPLCLPNQSLNLTSSSVGEKARTGTGGKVG